MKCDVTVIVQKKVSMREKWQTESEGGIRFVTSTLRLLFILKVKLHKGRKLLHML